MILLVYLLSPNLRPLAYLDPGSGSIIVQVLLAGLMAAAVLIKVFWKKIKALFTRSSVKSQDDGPDAH